MANINILPKMDTVYISFGRHFSHPDLHDYLNTLLSFDFLFNNLRDPATYGFINHNVPTVIKERIAVHLCSNSPHTDPANYPTATNKIKQCAICCVDSNLHNNTKVIQTNADIKTIYKRFIARNSRNNRFDLKIELILSELYLNHSTPFDHLNLAHYSHTPFQGPAMNPQTAAAPAAPGTTTIATYAQVM